jgi:exopolysaccharide biosynthesis polyprenyl glycosylphosphotransferase
MDHEKQFALRRLLVLMDALVVVLSMALAVIAHAVLREHFGALKDPPGAPQVLLIAFLTMPMMLSLAAAMGLHRQFERPFLVHEVLWDLLKLHVASLVGIALIIFLAQVPLNRSLVGLFLVSTFLAMLGSRLLLDAWRRRQHAGYGRQQVLLVGGHANLLERVILSTRQEDLVPYIVGILHPSVRPLGMEVAGVRVLGTLDSISRVLHDHAIDEVLIASSTLSATEFDQVLSACDDLGTPMRQLVLPDFHDGRRLRLERAYGLPFVTLQKTERSTEALALKRCIDLLGSSAALVLAAPVMLVIATAIALTMGRPVLFSQVRTGYRGRRFRMHKFRSMVADAEARKQDLQDENEMGGPVFKVTGDPRVTPLGRLLRKYSLDELPQLFNVFDGTMSLVGPRPLPVAEQQQISGPMRRRLSMKPGITGLWQVSGRSNLSFEEWMEMDLQYLDNWSNLEDLRLLALTLPAVVAGRGAR